MSIFPHRHKHPALPPMPVNARMLHMDGTQTPLELTYEGMFDDIHVWVAVRPIALQSIGDRLAVDDLPPGTQIRVVSVPYPSGVGDD